MIDHRQQGYMLPDGFEAVSTIFEKVIHDRHISRYSDEAGCLARYALDCYMGGMRDARELELRLKEACLTGDNSSPLVSSKTEVAEMLHEMLAYARNLTPAPVKQLL